MKNVILLFAILLGCLSAKSEVYYFVKSGTDLKSNTSIQVVYVDGKNGYIEYKTASFVAAKLNSDSYYWEDTMEKKASNSKNPYVYDSDMSTGKFDVYAVAWYGDPQVQYYGFNMVESTPVLGKFYFAISSDGNTMVKWKQRKNSDQVLNQTYYERIDEDVLNKDPHDFLH